MAEPRPNTDEFFFKTKLSELNSNLKKFLFGGSERQKIMTGQRLSHLCKRRPFQSMSLLKTLAETNLWGVQSLTTRYRGKVTHVGIVVPGFTYRIYPHYII